MLAFSATNRDLLARAELVISASMPWTPVPETVIAPPWVTWTLPVVVLARMPVVAGPETEPVEAVVTVMSPPTDSASMPVPVVWIALVTPVNVPPVLPTLTFPPPAVLAMMPSAVP